jgi:UDP-N-acetylmuramoylalanine--D-glutamate ligase
MKTTNMASITNALVIGLGASGEAAARLLAGQGARVTVADVGASPAVEARARVLQGEGMMVRTGSRLLPAGDFDLCVISPGVPLTDEWVIGLRQRGVQVLSELELGWRARASRVLAITGSNGKSTLVKLCREVLEAAGLHAVAGGNYGIPLSDWVRRRPAPDWIVTEVSSFQLEAVEQFAPDVGILLNINPNHLDRHGTMAVYAEMKARLFRRMGPGQSAVLPLDVLAAVRAAVPGTCACRTFGLGPEADYRYENGRILSRWLKEPVSVSDTVLDNEIMGLTAAACAAAMEGCGVSPHSVTTAARAFQGLPHRMEKVAALKGVSFVNDSKATNLAAMAAGLSMVRGPVRLIAGGRLKEKDLEPAKKVLVNRVKRVYLIGEYSQVMAAAWQNDVSCVVCSDLREAVYRAWKESGSGETILLSPGCASFDQFKSFEDRGEQFSEIVRQIERGGLA